MAGTAHHYTHAVGARDVELDLQPLLLEPSNHHVKNSRYDE
jgi:hypothetical protein